MLKSMTGFGRAEIMHGEKTFLIDIKSLNGKQFDLQLKMPSILRPYEFEIRNSLQEKLVRGTVECLISIKQNGTTKPVVLNTDLIKSYYLQLKSLSIDLGIDTNSVLASLLRLPEVVATSNEVFEKAEYDVFNSALQSAIDALNNHRLTEGITLENDLKTRLKNIKLEEEKIMILAPKREEKIREEITSLLEKNVGKENIDNNRMEQELIYYMEKIDLHEEQIRLRQHCTYFEEILNNADDGKGKKLSFLLQEIGREINTTGSKAYNADIQKCVVTMKDELEKAKEQILNVL